LNRYILTPRAKSDLRQLKRYHEERRPGKGKKLLDEAWQRIQRILLHPYAAPTAKGKVRRAKVPGFKINLYYFVRDNEIVVIAVMHQRRHPDAWKKRL
jgi:plasmid stabilization system protein ParE